MSSRLKNPPQAQGLSVLWHHSNSRRVKCDCGKGFELGAYGVGGFSTTCSKCGLEHRRHSKMVYELQKKAAKKRIEVSQ